MTHFLSCPVAARYINTCDDARAYYAYKLVGEHRIATVSGPIVVRFNAEEIHLFTDMRSPCPPGDVVARDGASGERRCFSLERARMLDMILPVLRAPAVAVRALIRDGVMVFGPADTSARRLCVVVAPSAREASTYFVRTAFPVSPRDFAAKLRVHRPAPWPPK